MDIVDYIFTFFVGDIDQSARFHHRVKRPGKWNMAKICDRKIAFEIMLCKKGITAINGLSADVYAIDSYVQFCK